jgi:hypothetical protein
MRLVVVFRRESQTWLGAARAPPLLFHGGDPYRVFAIAKTWQASQKVGINRGFLNQVGRAATYHATVVNRPEAIAVGSWSFVETVKRELRFKAVLRGTTEINGV